MSSGGSGGGFTPTPFYTGAPVSKLFMDRWRSGQHIGDAAPWCQVRIRRGRLHRRYHMGEWPGRQFGQVYGRSIRLQWYADWEPLDDWITVPGVSSIDLDQSFDKNGLCVASLDLDNEAWNQVVGHDGMVYHERERGIFWPWRGWHPKYRPGAAGTERNRWFNQLPNAQIDIRQGYGPDTAVRTFTGLIDSLTPRIRPDRIQLACRDFGSVLTDSHLFAWNIDRRFPDPVTFIPPDHKFLKIAAGSTGTPGGHRWVIVRDAVEIVECCLRWAGFKEWEVERSGVNINVPYVVDKSKVYMDVINAIKEQLGYVFFMGEPTEHDLSLGVPIFRRSSVLIKSRSKPIALHGKTLLTDFKPVHDNTDDKLIIRVRGRVDQKIGRRLYGDSAKRVAFTYWPPWMLRMSGVIKQLTYYNIGDASTIGFKNERQVTVAAVLIAVQIGLARDTATAQTPGNPALGLDSFAYITDPGTAIASRLYITNRKTTMKLGGEGTGAVSSQTGELLWATEVGGSLVDNPEMEKIVRDYQKATHGHRISSWHPY